MLMQWELTTVVFISYKNKNFLLFSQKIIPHLKSRYENIKTKSFHILCSKNILGMKYFTDIINNFVLTWLDKYRTNTGS